MSRALHFREEIAAPLFHAWRAGLSCSVIGVGSAGKTNLLQHIVRADVRAAYLGEHDGARTIPIVIDANILTPLPALLDADDESVMHRCWAGLELLLHRLIVSTYRLPALRERVPALYDRYEKMQNGADPTLYLEAVRSFEHALSLVLAADLRVVFVFDEFDELIRQMPLTFFRALRGLRDRNKGLLSYTTFTRAPIGTLIERHHAGQPCEAFSELFTDNTLYLAGYSSRDALEMLDSLNSRAVRPLTRAQLETMRELGGGFAGLTRALYRAAAARAQPDAPLTADDMLGHSAVVLDCLAIWRGLTATEQEILRAVARQIRKYTFSTAHAEEAMGLLIQKQLLQTSGGQLVIIPPVFRAFIEKRLYA
jgi:hypothetical protein